jgi:ATP-binding cassette subfamily F protein uup
MLAQRRGADLSLTPTSTEKARPPPEARAPAAPDVPSAIPLRKLSFKDKHALATLPARLEGLEREIAALEATIADASLYTRDATAFATATARLAAALVELAAAEEQWLALEIRREELERG